MKLGIALAFCLIGVASSRATDYEARGERGWFISYGWTISASPDDPWMTQGVPGEPGTITTLWIHCSCESYVPGGLGLRAFEADLSVVPIEPVTPLNGFLSLGEYDEHVALVNVSCPDPPVLVGSVSFLNTGDPLVVCLVPSQQNGFNLTVDCDGNGWDNYFQIGYSEAGVPPCVGMSGCSPALGVESNSWGAVKSLYR